MILHHILYTNWSCLYICFSHLQKEQSSPGELLSSSQKHDVEFETFDRDDPLNLSLPIKQEELARDSTEELLEAIRSVSPTATASELEASLTVSHTGLAMTHKVGSDPVNVNVVTTGVQNPQEPNQTNSLEEIKRPPLPQISHHVRLPPRLIHMPPPPPGHVYVPTQRLIGPPPPGYVAIPAGFNPRHIFPHEVLIPRGFRPTLDSQQHPMVPVAVAPAPPVHYIPGHPQTPNPKTDSVTPPPLVRALSAPPPTVQVQQNVINTTTASSASPIIHTDTPPPPKYEDVRPQNKTVPTESECQIKMEDEADQRLSDSTKKIIQALNDKLRKKQQQRQPSDSEDCVSLQEITNIINESMADEGEEEETVEKDTTLQSDASEITKCLNSVPKMENNSVNWDATNSLNWPSGRSVGGLGEGVVGNSRLSPVSSSSSTAPPTPSPSDAACNALVISPQNLLQPSSSSSSAGHPTYSDLKSPDSGFNECCMDTCVSPADSNMVSTQNG